jgi:hypothetical protein
VKGKPHYRLTVARKEGVPEFPPKINDNMFFEKNPKFRDILLAKCIMKSFLMLIFKVLMAIWLH